VRLGGDLAGALLDIAVKVLHVLIGLEADHVIGEERIDQPFMVRHGGDDLGRRKGDVQEEAHPVPDPQPAQLGAERDHVVVVDPDDVVLGQQPRQRARHPLVDGPVAIELGRVEDGEVEAIVKDRPERPVGIAEIIAVIFLLRQRLGGDGDGLLAVEMDADLGVVRHDVAGPAEPYAAAVAQHVADRDREAAGLRAFREVANPVRGEDDAAHVKSRS
jgi:hypothetical protein